ncbi:anion permease [Gammaproteobacteria bacterium]|nr:anion permease [Gammaproteobacteria bacterium]
MINKKILFLLPILTISYFVQADSRYFPESDWHSTTPESQGVKSAKVNKLIDLSSNISLLAADMSLFWLLFLILIITMATTDIINNAATAVIMAPISAGIGLELGYAIEPFLMVVAVGASCAFLTPIGHQCNTVVMGPGNYKFADYWRLGLPLDMLIIIISIPMILFVWT